MLTVEVDRQRISSVFSAMVTVRSDELFDAVEVRATKNGDDFGRGIGLCMLCDDLTVSDGIVLLDSPVSELTFDVEKNELDTDGDYRISVFVRNESGVWNDCATLMTAAGESVMDQNGAPVLVKREGGTEENYISAYKGAVIDSFVTEVTG